MLFAGDVAPIPPIPPVAQLAMDRATSTILFLLLLLLDIFIAGAVWGRDIPRTGYCPIAASHGARTPLRPRLCGAGRRCGCAWNDLIVLLLVLCRLALFSLTRCRCSHVPVALPRRMHFAGDVAPIPPIPPVAQLAMDRATSAILFLLLLLLDIFIAGAVWGRDFPRTGYCPFTASHGTRTPLRPRLCGAGRRWRCAWNELIVLLLVLCRLALFSLTRCRCSHVPM